MLRFNSYQSNHRLSAHTDGQPQLAGVQELTPYKILRSPVNVLMQIKVLAGCHREGVQHFMRATSLDIAVRSLYLGPSLFN
jgi:hypothetical protein